VGVRDGGAGFRAAASRLLPTLALTGSASDARSGLPDAVKAGLPDTRAYRGALDAGWEIDAFGAARAAADAAELDAQQADAGVAAAQWRVTTEVARQYAVWQGARLRLAKLEALLQAQRDTERLTRSRQAGGEASAFDVARAAGETQSLAAQLPPLRTQVAVTAHEIAVLLGASPSQPLAGLETGAPPELPEVPALATGQPAELLARRPDLRAAEARLLAEGARLRESRADLWPKFFVSAVFGREDLRLNLQDLAPVRYSNVALAFTMPLFNAGRLRAGVERQSARERGAALQYEHAVRVAVEDVENSLVALAQERERGAALDAATESRRRGLRHAESLYREGQIDLLQLLDAQRSLLAAELAAIDSRTQRVLGAVQLFKALGGGWQVAPAAAVVSESATSSSADVSPR
jgi:NodT family efflux transporter outer membrane factor (OMF) lipoprotein